MLKAKAIELLGGTIASAAEEIGVSYQAIDKWPAELPARIEDRVLAALARRHLPLSLIGAQAKDSKPSAPYDGQDRRLVNRRGPDRRKSH